MPNLLCGDEPRIAGSSQGRCAAFRFLLQARPLWRRGRARAVGGALFHANRSIVFVSMNGTAWPASTNAVQRGPESSSIHSLTGPRNEAAMISQTSLSSHSSKSAPSRIALSRWQRRHHVSKNMTPSVPFEGWYWSLIYATQPFAESPPAAHRPMPRWHLNTSRPSCSRCRNLRDRTDSP